MNEFICPNGRMSVNGVCPIFEGSDGQVKDFRKKSTYDAEKEDQFFEDVEKETGGIFKFDFEQDTESKNDNADNIINKNINYYRNFVENNLGIPANVQSAFTAASIGVGIATGGGLAAMAGPLAIPFFLGGAMRGKEEKRVRDITMKDPQGDVQTFPTKIMNIQPTRQDIYRGGGDGASQSRKSFSAPQQTSGPGGLHSNY